MRLIEENAHVWASYRLTGAKTLAAQDEEEKSWELASELGASVFFGASDQTSIVVKSDYKQTKDYFELAVSGAFDYGEAQAPGGDLETPDVGIKGCRLRMPTGQR